MTEMALYSGKWNDKKRPLIEEFYVRDIVGGTRCNHYRFRFPGFLGRSFENNKADTGLGNVNFFVDIPKVIC